MAQQLLAQAFLLLVFAASAELASTSSRLLADSAALVQVVARVKDESTEEKPPHIRPLRELLTEASKKWAAKSEEAGQKWLARQQDKLEGVNEKIQDKIRELSEPKEEEERSEVDRELSPEDEKLSKYGEPIKLIVVDPLEREFAVKFRKDTKLRALFSSLAKRTRLRPDAVSFMRGPQLLLANETAIAQGLVDGDIIELRSDVLQQKQEKKLRYEKAAARQAQVRAEKEEAERQDKLRRQAAKEKLLADFAVEQANRTNRTKPPLKLSKGKKKEMKRIHRRHVLSAGHMVDLKFVAENGTEVQMAFKRDNAFGPLQKLVSRRMGFRLADTAFFWNNELEDVPIHANSTVHSLRLPNHAVIKVRPVVPPVQ